MGPLTILMAVFCSIYNSTTGNIISHAEISYQIDDHFQIKLSGGYNEIQVQEILTNPVSAFNPRFDITSGSSAFSNNTVKTWILEPQIQYRTSIRKATLQILFGSTLEQDLKNAQAIYGFGYSSDALLADLQAASSTSVSTFSSQIINMKHCSAR